MEKVNVRDVPAENWFSPRGKFGCVFQGVSLALGRDEASTDLLKRHPFDLELCRVPPGKANYPYHSHSAQWELYIVVSGRGSVGDASGLTRAEPGDVFLFKPGEAHQLVNDDAEDWVLWVIADNPMGESTHYPDSGKWTVRSPERRRLRSENLEYLDGEE